ncbi:MAG: right-handed parallel beta-helix repeat-containing protein [Actinobacteria bacterium]|nr:right-handed parallel beta-helix repeat-containing protein [Actinomycetota bacterium]
MRRLRRLGAVAAATLTLVAGCTPEGDGPRTDRTPFVRPERTPRPVVTGTPAEIRLEVGDDFQRIVDRTPPGSTYVIATGVHRLQQVIPHDGDVFRGEPGAVLNGARLLAPESFDRDDEGRWFVDGQTQDGLERGQPDEGATEAIRHPEELFVDGDRRLVHVLSLGELTPGTFHLDYGADRLYLGEDPTAFASIEASVTSFAFGGTGVRGVTIEDIVVEKYASPAQFGAVGGAPPEEFPYDWTIRRVEARLNHGGGIGISPGVTIEDSDVHHNGQIGLVGFGEDRSTEEAGYSARVAVLRTRIHHNNVLGFRWTHEAGGTKIKRTTAGSLIEHVWSHDNHGPGLWLDIENHAAVVRANRIEDNVGAGIFYEISAGPTTIEHNEVRNNGHHDGGRFTAGIVISNSSDVTVRNNVLAGNARGVAAISRGDRHPATTRLVVLDNDITMSTGWTGLDLARDADKALLQPEGDNRFDGNTYRVADQGARWWFWDRDVSWAQWQDLGHDVGGHLVVGEGETTERARRGFRLADYGPRS